MSDDASPPTTEHSPDADRDEVAALRERVAELETRLDDDDDADAGAGADGSDQYPVSRRNALKAGGLFALLFGSAAAGAASATSGTTNDDDTKWGSDSNRDDYYADVVDANVVDSKESNDVYVAPKPSDSSDIGAEINDIHDNKCSTGDAIFVPPGEYHNQQTKIDITKDITLFSTGDWRSPGARIYKQSDMESIQTQTGSDRSGGSIDESIDLIGLMFSGADVSDTSNGVRIRGCGHISISSHDHGQDGVYFYSKDGEAQSDMNGADVDIVANANGRDGVRTENGPSGININAMDVRLIANENGGNGLTNINGYSWRLWIWAQVNGGKGFDLQAESHSVWAHVESNGTDSTAPGGRITITSGLSSGGIDRSSFGVATVLRKGDTTHAGANGQVLFNSPQGSSTIALQEGDTGSDANLKLNQFDLLFQTEDSTDSLQNVLGIEQGVDTPDVRVMGGDGAGVVVTTPDGTDDYRIRVDNNGNVVTDQL